MDTGIKESGGLVDSSQGNKIRNAGGIYASKIMRQQTKEKDAHT